MFKKKIGHSHLGVTDPKASVSSRVSAASPSESNTPEGIVIGEGVFPAGLVKAITAAQNQGASALCIASRVHSEDKIIGHHGDVILVDDIDKE